MVAALTPVEIFCSYAHEDEAWLRKLEAQLSLLKRQGLISLWHDRLITAGTDWAHAIDQYLETASVILLLVSADFFASDYCVGIEMKRALERQKAGEALVIPILVRQVDWTDAPFGHLHALPTDAKPLTSWQNEDTALADVAAGIRRVIVEELPQLTTSAPHTVSSNIGNIPHFPNPFFLGRDELFTRLRNHLQAGRPTALSGLGGIGKTQIAIEYAYRFCQDYHTILWASAESWKTLSASYSKIARHLALPEHNAQEQQVVVQAVKRWLQTHDGWLLILDNADDLALLPDFLPPRWGGHLLLTTCARATGRLAHRLEVETLPPEQGALFLLRRSGLVAPDAPLEQALPQEQELARQISQELGGLPLALDQAGAYLEATGTDLTDYQQVYLQCRARLLRERRGLGDNHPESVATTLLLSFQQVEKRNRAAAELMQLCAFLHADAIPEKILTEGSPVLGPMLSPVTTDLDSLNRSIETLLDYSLIERNPRTKMLSIHRMVQAVLQDEMDQKTRKLWAKRAARAVYKALLWVEYQPKMQCDRLLPQAQYCAEWIEKYHLTFPEAIRFLTRTARYLREMARYEEAEPLYQLALDIGKQRLGEKPQILLSSEKLAATRCPRRQHIQEVEERSVKKLINRSEDLVKEALTGMAVTHKDLISVMKEHHVIVRKDAPVKGKVGIISGGGSGHEPLHSGFVGIGMLDAACIGPVFTSPTEDQVIAATHAVNGGAGVLYIVKNYLGDKANFLSAVVELAETDKIEVAVVFTDDEVGVPGEDRSNCRGLGVTVLLEKIVGGFAQPGTSLRQVASLAEKVNANGRSMGIALTSCTLPATGKPLFELSEDEMTLGVGIHGQRGQSILKLETADEISERLVSPIIQDLGLQAGQKVLALVSGLGGTPLLELYVIFNAVKRLLDRENITIARQLVGNYITSLEMAGCSLSLVRLDDELTRYWDAPVHTPALRWGC